LDHLGPKRRRLVFFPIRLPLEKREVVVKTPIHSEGDLSIRCSLKLLDVGCVIMKTTVVTIQTKWRHYVAEFIGNVRKVNSCVEMENVFQTGGRAITTMTAATTLMNNLVRSPNAR